MFRINGLDSVTIEVQYDEAHHKRDDRVKNNSKQTHDFIQDTG